MSVWSLIDPRQSPTFGGEESAEQKSEEGAETQENDDPNASQEFEAGLEQHDRDDKKDGHEEGRDAEANEKVEHEEKEQETQKDNDRKAEEEDDDDEEAKAKENELAKEKTEAEKQDEDHEKVEHEDQKQQTQKEKDREEDEEEDDKDANETDKERVKEVAGNADAKAHQHEEPEGAEEPVTKRDRALKTHTSDEVEPPKKVNKCSLLSPETGPGLDLVDRRAATATGLGVPLATGHEESTSTLTPQKWGKREAKRGRILSKHPSAEDAPPKKVNKALMSVEPKLVEEVEDDEEQKRQAELRRAEDQLQKCLADEDYTGAAAAKDKIAALMSAEPKLRRQKSA